MTSDLEVDPVSGIATAKLIVAIANLVRNADYARIELFAFRRDPLELRDIAAEQPPVATKLWSLSERWQDKLDRRGRPDPETPILDPETIESLRTLGYLP